MKQVAVLTSFYLVKTTQRTVEGGQPNLTTPRTLIPFPKLLHNFFANCNGHVANVPIFWVAVPISTFNFSRVFVAVLLTSFHLGNQVFFTI